MKVDIDIKHTTLWRLGDGTKTVDCQALDELLKDTEQKSPKAWWLPWTEDSLSHLWDKQWTLVELAGQCGRIVGACCLFLHPHEYADSCKALGLDTENVAELGRCMVEPTFRGQNLMYELNSQLIPFAQNRGITTLVATVHPDNIASKKSLEKLGMSRVGSIVKAGYPRDLYRITV